MVGTILQSPRDSNSIWCRERSCRSRLRDDRAAGRGTGSLDPAPLSPRNGVWPSMNAIAFRDSPCQPAQQKLPPSLTGSCPPPARPAFPAPAGYPPSAGTKLQRGYRRLPAPNFRLCLSMFFGRLDCHSRVQLACKRGLGSGNRLSPARALRFLPAAFRSSTVKVNRFGYLTGKSRQRGQSKVWSRESEVGLSKGSEVLYY